MFIEMVFFLFFGIAVGVVTGLIPGLHPNTVFVLLLSLSAFFTQVPGPYLLVFIISLALCNTFTNFIPSILFGAPEPESCLSVLPGHKFLMAGKGYEALFLTVIGGIGVTALAIITLPVLLFVLPAAYSLLQPYIHAILIFVVVWMCLTERNRAAAAIVFLLSGVFGFVGLNSLPSSTVLFPALTGLFGFSGLVVSLMSKIVIPPQKEPGSCHITKGYVKGSVAGWLAGMLTGILPGVGAAQAGVVVAQTFRAKTREFLTALGGINTANIFFTFVAFYTLGKTRSGAAWAVSQVLENITFFDVLLLACVGAIVCFLSVIITLTIGKFIICRITQFDYARLNVGVILSLLLMVFLFSGAIGLLVAFTGTCIGLLAILSGTRRTHMMGFLILPTIFYFSGISSFLLALFGL